MSKNSLYGKFIDLVFQYFKGKQKHKKGQVIFKNNLTYKAPCRLSFEPLWKDLEKLMLE